MRPIVALTLLLVSLGGCTTEQPPYPELTGITRINVRQRASVHGSAGRSISHPDSLAAIVGFVNARRDGWAAPWYGVPVPVIIADFYRGEAFAGHVGVGSNFFEAQRSGDFASRKASPTEIMEFVKLLGSSVLIAGAIEDR
jgi:hypothetical protein